MTQEQINENNALIAEFMSYDKNRIVYELPIDRDGNYVNFKDGIYYVYIHSLQYNNSWDQLMKVIEKIENTGFTVTICKNVCNIVGDISFNTASFGSNSKIDSVYKSVIDFIKFHNNQK